MFLSILRLFQTLLAAFYEVSEIQVRRTYDGPWTRRDT